MTTTVLRPASFVPAGRPSGRSASRTPSAPLPRGLDRLGSALRSLPPSALAAAAAGAIAVPLAGAAWAVLLLP